jgi:F-type H+-transporting ATPase subunit alpha
VRPAINVGISVSRVGGSAQVKAMRSVAGNLRLSLAQFRELEAFAAFGSDLDKASKASLERGVRLVELLKQPQYQPQSVERQVVSIWTGTTGKLDEVPVEDIKRFDAEFLDYIATSHAGIFEVIRETKVLGDDTVAELQKAVDAFKGQFTTSSGELLVKDVPVEALEEAEIDPTQITKKVK